ncbi:putative mannosyltransferase [Saccharomyces paradoxus]|uniref:Mannosyltransferase n=1 Tax=Saccharomyces paradoxus TaxID=27291 RepID=A0A8B8UMB8_SACPA|nr:Ktr4 [Saccharomyces paradoxus]QHS71759.1 Ktr4 [Saccharomyces paradoxus]
MRFLSKRILKPVLSVIILISIIITVALYILTSNENYLQAVKDSAKSQYASLRETYKSIAGGTESTAELPDHDAEVLDGIFDRLREPLYDKDSFDPNEVLAENKQLYDEFLAEEISEPKVDNLVRSGDPLSGKAKGTILSLVRNVDLDGIISSIQQLEEEYNKNFGYPYTFLNDEEFTDEFKDKIKSILPNDRLIEFGTIDPNDWNMPDNIDRERYDREMDKLGEEKIQYAEVQSYHNMCRFYSKEFYHHPLLSKYRYVWRLEPKVNFYCKIKYDVFQFMSMNDKIYGFVLNLYDSPQTIRTLWTSTMDFVEEHPNYLNANGAFGWLKDNSQNPDNYDYTQGYSTCHFWTNFEIVDLEFLRSEPYEQYMQYLEEKGGFYYERWGDAPVRSLALALFADKSRIHWFRDIGYYHTPYTNCPTCPEDSDRCNGNCIPGKFTPWSNLDDQNCQASWIRHSMNDEELGMY